MRTFAFKFVGTVSVVVHNAQSPTDAELREYLRALENRDVRTMRSLVFTTGGGPTPAQRKELNRALNGDHPTAVVSNGAMVRGIVTALGWFNSKIKAFAPEDVEGAFRYLEIPPSEFELFLREIKVLQAQVGDRPTLRSVSRRL